MSNPLIYGADGMPVEFLNHQNLPPDDVKLIKSVFAFYNRKGLRPVLMCWMCGSNPHNPKHEMLLDVGPESVMLRCKCTRRHGTR